MMHGGERSCAGGIDIPHVPVGNSALVAKSLFATGIHGDVYPSSGTLSLYYLVSSPPLRDPTASVSSNILFFFVESQEYIIKYIQYIHDYECRNVHVGGHVGQNSKNTRRDLKHM